jgi:hypothetical protein
MAGALSAPASVNAVIGVGLYRVSMILALSAAHQEEAEGDHDGGDRSAEQQIAMNRCRHLLPFIAEHYRC